MCKVLSCSLDVISDLLGLEWNIKERCCHCPHRLKGGGWEVEAAIGAFVGQQQKLQQGRGCKAQTQNQINSVQTCGVSTWA
jgi:hypothetical protein